MPFILEKVLHKYKMYYICIEKQIINMIYNLFKLLLHMKKQRKTRLRSAAGTTNPEAEREALKRCPTRRIVWHPQPIDR